MSAKNRQRNFLSTIADYQEPIGSSDYRFTSITFLPHLECLSTLARSVETFLPQTNPYIWKVMQQCRRSYLKLGLPMHLHQFAGLTVSNPGIFWKQAGKSKMHKPCLIGNAQMLILYLSLIDDIIYSLSQQSYLSIFFSLQCPFSFWKSFLLSLLSLFGFSTLKSLNFILLWRQFFIHSTQMITHHW